jgi:hypothetical protein
VSIPVIASSIGDQDVTLQSEQKNVNVFGLAKIMTSKAEIEATS